MDKTASYVIFEEKHPSLTLLVLKRGISEQMYNPYESAQCSPPPPQPSETSAVGVRSRLVPPLSALRDL